MSKEGLKIVETAIINHTAKDEDTQLTHKGILALIQHQNTLPCDETKKQVDKNKTNIESLNKTRTWVNGYTFAIAGVFSIITIIVVAIISRS